VGGVWARLRNRDEGIAETKNRTDDIAVGRVLGFAIKAHIPLFIISAWTCFCKCSFCGTSGGSSVGIHSLVAEETRWQAATSFPSFLLG